jgi:hypothetical protein
MGVGCGLGQLVCRVVSRGKQNDAWEGTVRHANLTEDVPSMNVQNLARALF